MAYSEQFTLLLRSGCCSDFCSHAHYTRRLSREVPSELLVRVDALKATGDVISPHVSGFDFGKPFVLSHDICTGLNNPHITMTTFFEGHHDIVFHEKEHALHLSAAYAAVEGFLRKIRLICLISVGRSIPTDAPPPIGAFRRLKLLSMGNHVSS